MAGYVTVCNPISGRPCLFGVRTDLEVLLMVYVSVAVNTDTEKYRRRFKALSECYKTQ